MIPFSPPNIHPDVILEIEDTLKSGWITTGPKTKRFEKDVTAYTGCKATNAVNSATAGMEMVLRWFGIGPGDEVIVPAYTYCATANVVVHLGAVPVFADISSNDFNMDPDKIAGLITKNTKAIVPVDIGGLPCDYRRILEIATASRVFDPKNENQKKLGRILVMADAAHSFGARMGNQISGTFTDVTVFSFHAVKNLTTAEGGAICWNLPDPFDNHEVYKAMNVRVLHGQSKDALAKTKAGGWRYDVEEPGFKCNMTDILACVGLVSLKHYDADLARRRDIAEQYADLLKQYEWALLPVFVSDEKTSSYHLFQLRIKGISEGQRDRMIEEINKRGVSVNVHFIPVPELTAYKKRGYDIANYPETLSKFENEITLPLYYNLTDDQVREVVKAVVESVESVINA